jgi:hypothetical protein
LQKNYNIINAKKREEKREDRRIARGEEEINIIIRRIFTSVCIFINVFILIIFIVSYIYKEKVNHIFNILY